MDTIEREFCEIEALLLYLCIKYINIVWVCAAAAYSDGFGQFQLRLCRFRVRVCFDVSLAPHSLVCSLFGHYVYGILRHVSIFQMQNIFARIKQYEVVKKHEVYCTRESRIDFGSLDRLVDDGPIISASLGGRFRVRSFQKRETRIEMSIPWY